MPDDPASPAIGCLNSAGMKIRSAAVKATSLTGGFDIPSQQDECRPGGPIEIPAQRARLLSIRVPSWGQPMEWYRGNGVVLFPPPVRYRSNLHPFRFVPAAGMGSIHAARHIISAKSRTSSKTWNGYCPINSVWVRCRVYSARADTIAARG